MKGLIKIKYCILIVAVCAGFVFKACKRETPVYGDAYIYMPQSVASGGLNNMYVVPSGGGTLTYNIKPDNGKIDIMLGVSRSGTAQGKDFTVDITARNDETGNFISSGVLPNAVALPESSYSLPSQVAVTGSNHATFYLSVDSAMLMNDLSYTGQKLVLAVGISNATSYTISDNNNITMVVIDVDAIRDHFFKFTEGFLYKKANKLMLNGMAYQCGGINSVAISGCGSDDEIFNEAEVDALFSSLPANILVRTWAFAENKDKTDKIVKAAEKNNIKLILVLANQNGFCGDPYDNKDQDWYTSGFRNGYLGYVKEMAAAYKNSPAIGMWEMVNEPTMWNADVETLKAFFNEVAKAIKEADPNHLVATGAWANWAYDGKDGFQTIHNSNYIDVGTLHEGDQDVVEGWSFPDCVQAMNELNKVLIVEDISIEGGTAADCFSNITGRAEIMKNKIQHYLDNGAGAALASYLVKNVASECSRQFAADDPVMNVVKALPANANLGK
ncbi:MAG: cellulase family glycosylhydrolase [Agriterribacter sp.]